LHNLIHKGEETPLFFRYYKDIEANKIKLYIYKDDEFVEVDTTFEKIDKYFYRCIVNFDFVGKYCFKVEYEDNRIGGGIVTIKENILQKIYNIEFGNWQIKDNKMYFYDTNNNILAEFNLYDEKGNPTSESVFLRERV
jgi:hypothetical protein